VTDLAALEAQVADLTAKVAALRPSAPVPALPPAPVEVAPRPVRLHTLIGGVEMSYLHRDPRVLRQLAEAVALCRGVPNVAQEVPQSWVPDMRRVAASRVGGKSWRDALTEAGLEAPSDLETQARAVRLELDELWSRLLPLVGLTLGSVNSTAKITLTASLKRLLG
jgi:hypothetical protein